MIVRNGKEGLECGVFVERMRFERVSEFKYLGCVSDESGRGDAECGHWEESCRCY